MRERCECGKANCVYCNPIDIPARSELLVQIEQLQTENRKLEDRLKWKDEDYQEMRELSSKFEQAFAVTEAELAKAKPILEAAIKQEQYFSENGDSTVFQILCGKTNTAVREHDGVE